MLVIAFGHRKRTGKGTLGQYLATELKLKYPGKRIVQIGFADKVKDVSHQIYGWAGVMPGSYYDTPANEHLREVILPLIGKSPRDVWIAVGNGLRASLGNEALWLDYAFNHHKCDVMIFTDLRFPTEAEGVLEHGGWLYRVDRASAPIVTDGADDILKSYDGWTGTFANNGTLNDIYAFARHLVTTHFSTL